MVVQHNISAMNANRYYGINNKALAGSLEKLSSGYAINRASDNAAGLAVSEKMRAQIGGLTQASKNAEDGISLVQTMEGALQETDSILQRMRTLAVQSANGSYQDDVDREAMQLEFDQLNDELNQIADTDFNGVVMLNGGQMADGLKATDGTFDYANKSDQLLAQAKEQATANVQAAQNKLAPLKATYESTKYDLSASGNAAEWNDVDQNSMEKADLDKLWQNLDSYGSWDATNSKADTKAVNEITVTFTKQADNTWKATDGKVTGGSAENINKSLGADKLQAAFGTGAAENQAGTAADATGTGGFTTAITGATNNANVVFDSTNAKAGDTVTLVFRNGNDTKMAPDNIGFNEDSKKVTYADDSTTALTKDSLTVALGDSDEAVYVTDDDMTSAIKNSLDALEDAEVKATYSSTATTATSGDPPVTTTTWGDASVSATITLADGKENTLNLSAENAETELFDKDGNTVGYAVVKKLNDDTDGTKIEIMDSGKSKTLFTLSLDKASDEGTTAADITNGTVSGKLSISTSAFSEGQSYGVTAGSDVNGLTTSAENKKAYDKAVDEYNEAYNDMRSIKDVDSAVKFLGKDKVSISDAFNQSRATMTYTDKLGLQVGARTKDLVNFSFSYNSNGLGDLKANLNCSAREDGLGTASLSIADQKSANDAIDKIDNALNKISMVRATFGAAQNRLEHKINTLDTNNENITAAESRIRDTQMDKEMMKFTSSQILSQASQSMLAQANSLPQGVLQLLG